MFDFHLSVHTLNLIIPTIVSVSVLALALATADSAEASCSASDLRTEYLKDPMGIDGDHPRLSWSFVQTGKGRKQSGYQVQVATSVDLLDNEKPNLWNTGKVESSQSVAVTYRGERLVSGQACYWRVKVWDKNGKASGWSQPAMFEMGLLREADWQGKWTTAPMGGNGYHSEITPDQEAVKWFQVHLGNPKTFERVKLFPARPINWNEDEPGFGFPVRYKIEACDEPEFKNPTLLVDKTADDQAHPGDQPVLLEFSPVTAKYVRVTGTKLYSRKDGQKVLAMAELQALSDLNVNLAAQQPVKASDSVEEQGWSTQYLTEGTTHSSPVNRGAPMFRKEFTLDKKVKKARAYICGLGYYELSLNGKKVGDRVLDPSYTNFDKRCLYSTYDVAHLLSSGANAAGIILGKGWFAQSPSVILQLNIEFEDGTSTSLVTDGSWKRGSSPITQNSLYHGETYDARLDQPGWNQPGFDDSQWEDAEVTVSPTQKLSAQMIQPIKVVETRRFKTMKPGPNVWVFDFGQNFSGWTELTAAGPSGQEIRLKYSELLYPDGTVNMENLRAAQATDRYILKGRGTEVYQPRFTYHGFRYVQMENFPGHPEGWDVLRGKVVHTAFDPVGSFECSDELINQIQHNSQWGFKTNFHSIPTDCPQRDERQGWMGDAHMTADMGFYNYDMPAAYNKFLQDISDAQGEDGRIPDTVPHIWGTNPGDPMWSAAYHIIVWDMYRHTGDKELLKRHYPGLKSYVDMLGREAQDYIITRNNYGDWVGIVETPKDLISTGSFLLVSRIVERIAGILENEDDQQTYNALCSKIAEAFNAKYFNPETAVYGNGSQYSYVWPLYLSIVPTQRHDRVVKNLVDDIMVNHKGHLSTGFLGARYLFEVLCNEGQAEAAYSIITKRDYPSYGYMIENGATTVWELWKLETGPGMNSHNHPAFGFISGWFYRDIAGIKPRWQTPGFEKFDIKPQMMGDLKSAKASVKTVKGEVASAWNFAENGELTLDVTVPANATADVYIPVKGRKSATVTESGSPISGEAAGDWLKVQVESGKYSFKVSGE